jgi:TPR repeat protein
MAQCNLGSLIECGRGVAQNYGLAAKWYSKAADQGLAQAQCNMGRVCLHGRGVAQSDVEAVRWFKKAAAQGNEKAKYNLQCLFQEGIGGGYR